MKQLLKTTLILSFAIAFCGNAAMAVNPSNVGFSFLKISPGARNAAMGDLGVSVSSSLYGVYFNPAVIADVKESWVGFMHHENIFDSRREFAGFTTPLFGGGASIGFDYFKFGSIESREGPTEEPLGTFDARDILFYGALAIPVAERAAIGATIKYAAEKIGAETADAFFFDVGARLTPIKHLAIGVAGRNIGSSPKFKTEEFDVPVTVAGGVSLDIKRTLIGAEVANAKGDDTKVHLGVEQKLADFVSLRAGYKINYDEEDMSFGVGFAKSRWVVDYAFVPFKEGVGSNHRFALTVQLK